MSTKHFFSPVLTITWEEAYNLVAENAVGVVFLDVRQPLEYAEDHFPGAKLLPLGNLDNHLEELDKEKYIVTYCSVGARSRVAAQMLSGKGFCKIYNLGGGIRAREKGAFIGPEDIGLQVLSGEMSTEDVIVAGFVLQMVLRDIYLLMQSNASREDVKNLFGKLAYIEFIHEKHLLGLYNEITGNALTLKEFTEKIVRPIMTGSLTSKDYMQRYKIDQESDLEILSLAMAIEAQALDLYSRVMEKNDDYETCLVLQQISADERSHIAMLGKYIDEQMVLV